MADNSFLALPKELNKITDLNQETTNEQIENFKQSWLKLYGGKKTNYIRRTYKR